MHTVTFTRDNFVGPDNNRLVYDVPGSASMEGTEVALSTLYMYYSWQNINNTTLLNNTFQFTLPTLTQDSAGAAVGPFNLTYTVVLPNGLYEIADINAFLQDFCIQNNLFLINATTGEYVYFIQLQTNITLYKVQLNLYALPTPATLAGYNLPAAGFAFGPNAPGVGALGAFPATADLVCGMNLASSPGFPTIVGAPGAITGTTTNELSTSAWAPKIVSAGTFPTANAVWLSNIAPNVQPNSVIFLNLNVIANVYSNPQTVLYPIAAKAAIGDLLIIEPPEYAWNKVMPGTISQLVLTFTDRNGSPIKILDPDVVITLVIKDQIGEHANLAPETTGNVPHSKTSQTFQRHPANTRGPTHTQANAVARRLTNKSNS